jgi:hypothetical protein
MDRLKVIFYVSFTHLYGAGAFNASRFGGKSFISAEYSLAFSTRFLGVALFGVWEARFRVCRVSI